MARFLALSSQVASGHVGLSAIVPALHLLGHDVVALPTVVLSNHPGHPHVAGFRIEPDQLARMCDALAANGRLDAIDVVLTGYLPSPGHVAFAADLVRNIRTRRPEATYVCDPVLGDDPKGLYIDRAAAEAIRAQLLPMADVALPNRFELAWLTGNDVTDLATAIAAGRALPTPRVVTTSIAPDPSTHPATLATVQLDQDTAHACLTPLRDRVPNGTGDLLSALFAAEQSLPMAMAQLNCVLERSSGRPELALIEAARQWPECAPARSWRVLESGETVEDLSTRWVAGVDACTSGWAVVMHPLNAPENAELRVVEDFAAVLRLIPEPGIIAVDMPIGLPERAIRGGRRADIQARAVLGDRRSSVFAVPSRAAVECVDYYEACASALTTSDPPRKVARQTFNLFPKIREVDKLMSPALQQRVYEVHPEVAFWALNDDTPLPLPKKVESRPHPPGLELRKKLLAVAGYRPDQLQPNPRANHGVGTDDILDACAAAWTAARIAHGHARRFPDEPELDARGLRMEICC